MANYNYIALEDFENALIAPVGETVTLPTSRGNTCEVERVETTRGIVFSIHGDRFNSFGTEDGMTGKAVFNMLLALQSPRLKVDGEYYKVQMWGDEPRVWYYENRGWLVAHKNEQDYFLISEDFAN